MANRNRTLKHLYENDIQNNIFLAGDSHKNWYVHNMAQSSLYNN
ncbi:alkaline phosphatase D family protein [Candidatus Bathyarchaeota archaeon]|nr:alkaline phosphatase D family protein [Candidatus Bathyarchaeota archaeon]